jgi:carbon storage regulator
MLVLTRKRSEMIQIGEGIVIRIIHTGRNAVKIGIQAPHDVRVMRAELCHDQPQTLHSLVMERRNRLPLMEATLQTAPPSVGIASI